MMTTETLPGFEAFTSEDIADRLGVSVRTLWRLVRAGDFPPADISPNRKLKRWTAPLLRNWLAAQAGVDPAAISIKDAPACLSLPRLSAMITPQVAARMLGVDESTVRRMVDQGRLNGYHRPGCPASLLLVRAEVNILAVPVLVEKKELRGYTFGGAVRIKVENFEAYLQASRSI